MFTCTQLISDRHVFIIEREINLGEREVEGEQREGGKKIGMKGVLAQCRCDLYRY